MPVECLIHATDKPGGAKKGDIQVVNDAPFTWGSGEGLPDFVILEINNATRAQVLNFLDRWTLEFTHDVVDLGGGVRQVTASMDSRIAARFPAKATQVGIRLRDYLVNRWGAFDTSFPASNSIRASFPPLTPLLDVQAAILDRFNEVLQDRFMRFDSADVDTAIAQGGRVNLTRAQAIARITDTR